MKLNTFIKTPYRKYRKFVLQKQFKKTFESLCDNFDSIYDVDTEGLDANNYGAVRASVFDEIMKITSPLHKQQWFVDIGSGKGRALLLAALRPFKKIIGIEIKYDYCRVAKENIARASKRIPGTERIEIECTDAFWWVSQHWPVHKEILFFMYHPFSSDTFKEVYFPYENFFGLLAENIKNSNNHVILAFVNPLSIHVNEGRLRDLGFLKIAENKQVYSDLSNQILSYKLFDCGC